MLGKSFFTVIPLTLLPPLPSKDIQSSLTARSSEVSSVVFDIQVFISERAQDLAPEQSRLLLGQLQQLQKAFHRASGRAHAWADALSAQRDRDERVKEEEKERERKSAREREVWKEMTEHALQRSYLKLRRAFLHYSIKLLKPQYLLANIHHSLHF